ncbi:MAG: glycosyltransferase family 9 protein [gamma proteobacterium symbiont of Taylorina sp.]|nr:glycosyltransferase family 9 protein [gamma proteobacterium symbiont of Taylorina sp.]
MTILRTIIKELYYFLDILVKLFPVRQTNKIVLIKSNEIGDFVLWLASARHYKKIYRKRKIVVIANASWAELLIREDIFDKVIVLKTWRFRVNLFYRLKKLFEIRNTGAKTIVNLLYSKDLYLSDTIVRCSGAKERIGILGDSSNYELPRDRPRGEKHYTQLLKIDISGLHEFEINQQLQLLLSKKEFPLDYPCLQYQKNFSAPPYYVLFPGAGGRNRQWPVENFSEMARWIYNKTGMSGIICGLQNEQSLAETLMNKAQVPLLNLAGKTDLTEFVDKIANAQFVLSNDTSAIHIACAANTPSVAILGGGHFGRFLPYVKIPDKKKLLPAIVFHKMDCFGCEWNCNFVKFDELVPCVEKVTISGVEKILMPLLKEIHLSDKY